MKTYLLKTGNGNINGALASFFQGLLENGTVDSLLVPQEVYDRSNVKNILVKDSKSLGSINPLAPVSMLNAARIVSRLTAVDPGEKIGVVLRPCEIRALVELVKLQQAALDNLVIIGMDCAGTFEPGDYRGLVNSENWDLENWLAAAAGGETAAGDRDIRTACSMCNKLQDGHAHINIGWLGLNPAEGLTIGVIDDLAGEIDRLGLAESGEDSARAEALKNLEEKRGAYRQKQVEELASRINGPEDMARELAGCIGCYNCRQACPVCFCRECVFNSPVLTHQPGEYLQLAQQKSALEMPPDKLLFHITRINHMAVSCVGCGQCESACPSGLPLALLFTAAGKQIQDIFEYVPARDVEEEFPLSTYRENELEPQ